MAATPFLCMHTAIPLVFGAFTGWLAALFVRAGDGAHIASYVAISVAGASVGSWLVDAAAVAYGRNGEIYPGVRVALSFFGSTLLIAGFRLIW